jgi:isocitrate dehydrogenase
MTPTPVGETLARNANGLLRSLDQTLNWRPARRYPGVPELSGSDR